MNKRIILALMVTCTLLLSAATQAQDQAGPSPEEQAMMQQMQQMGQQIMQNMQAKGIDPQQFFQQMQNGADPADIQQKMIDQGIIDPQMITQMQGSFQKVAFNRIKQQLAVTEDEWSALLPIVQKVVSAQADVAQRSQAGAGGMMGGFLSAQPSDLTIAMKELRTAIKDPTSAPGLIEAKVAAVRDAYRKASDALAAAQAELISLLTTRQEATLVVAGLLP